MVIDRSSVIKKAPNTHNQTNIAARLEKLEKILGEDRYQQRYVRGSASIHQLIVLPQPRMTFERIPELGTDLARKGQLNNLIVAKFGAAECEQYLQVINLLWGTDFTLSQFNDYKIISKRGSETLYYVLIAGQRRWEGFRHDWVEGCLDCQEKYGKEEPSVCFLRHFKRDRVEVKFCVNISPLAALFIQFSENTHMQVPPHEEAKAYFQLFHLIRKARLKISRGPFCSGGGTQC